MEKKLRFYTLKLTSLLRRPDLANISDDEGVEIPPLHHIVSELKLAELIGAKFYLFYLRQTLFLAELLHLTFPLDKLMQTVSSSLGKVWNARLDHRLCFASLPVAGPQMGFLKPFPLVLT